MSLDSQVSHPVTQALPVVHGVKATHCLQRVSGQLLPLKWIGWVWRSLFCWVDKHGGLTRAWGYTLKWDNLDLMVRNLNKKLHGHWVCSNRFRRQMQRHWKYLTGLWTRLCPKDKFLSAVVCSRRRRPKDAQKSCTPSHHVTKESRWNEEALCGTTLACIILTCKASLLLYFFTVALLEKGNIM